MRIRQSCPSAGSPIDLEREPNVDFARYRHGLARKDAKSGQILPRHGLCRVLGARGYVESKAATELWPAVEAVLRASSSSALDSRVTFPASLDGHGLRYGRKAWAMQAQPVVRGF